MSQGCAFSKFARIILVGVLVPIVPIAAQEESRWDPAFGRMTPLLEVQGHMIMTDPCFYYLSFGSGWLEGRAQDTFESQQVALGIQPDYRNLRLNDETLQSCYYWAQRGKSSHQYGLGLMYLNGDQVDQDHARAYFWLTIAAQAGHKLAPKYINEAKHRVSSEVRQSVLDASRTFEPLED